MAEKKVFVEPPACAPSPFDIPDASAFQALVRGDATPDQQQRAVNWLLYKATGTYDADYRKDSRDHAFMAGKRFVGLQVVKLISLNLAKLKEQK